ncbi:hypothetical protein DPX16_23037 [Anabarilius grahami]|uniref:Serine/arginine repetitive matrix protein 2 n=1 Tax=Anabarilius grahami TaxID=495550 RepID=A0A3N0XHG4_ANAGA|nr:hypothetical protein DPX16_23037 [Anabarilius grahami]
MKDDMAPLQEARGVSEDLLENPHQVGEITVVDHSHTPKGPRSWVNAENDHTDSGCRTRITSIPIPAHRIHSGAAGGLLHPAQAALLQSSTGSPHMVLYMDRLAIEHHSSMEITLATHLHLAISMALHQKGGFLHRIVPSGVPSDAQALRSMTGAGAPHLVTGPLADQHLVGTTGMAQEVILTPLVGIRGSPAHPKGNPESFMEGVHIQRERDQRGPHGDVGRESRRPGMEWAHGGGGSPQSRPPYRSPARRPGPPPSGSSFRPYPPLRPQERPIGRPFKRKSQEFRRPPSSSGFEHGPPKRFRRELSVRPLPLRGFRGRGLSLNDKSRLLKARKFRAESVARFKLPPPRISDRDQKHKPQTTPKNGKDSSGVPPRKIPLKKMPSSRESSPSTVSKTAEPERESETKMESRRSVSAHSSSPIDRRLSRDLVVVSHWEAGHKPSTSSKNNAPWRNKAPKNKSEESESHGNLTLNERFTKLQSPTSSSQEQKERRSSGSPEKTLRKPASFQRPNFRSTVGVKRGPAPDGVLRKPLMGSLIPRPPFNQKPVFKKSQSIMSKYKNLQTLRHKVPHQRQATSYRRW